MEKPDLSALERIVLEVIGGFPPAVPDTRGQARLREKLRRNVEDIVRRGGIPVFTNDEALPFRRRRK
jgi:hypothetical protein